MTTESTKQKVKVSAQKLFRERGYAAIGMRQLAKAVGIQAPSLYNHYKSKDQLLSEICFDMAAQFFSAYHIAIEPKQTIAQQLQAAIQAHIRVIAQNPEAAEVFFNEWMFLEQPSLRKFKKLRAEYETKFRELIEKGIKKGELKPMNTKLISFTVFSALNATYELYHTNEKIPTAQIEAHISGLLLSGIKK